jgi:ABC-2 type transport system permease protein
MISIFSYVTTFFALMRTQLLIFHSNFWDKLINLYIWTGSTLLISAYLLPHFGISTEYGLFMVPGTIITAGLFELYPRVVNLIHDFEGDRVIFYQLTLPLPAWLYFIHIITVQTISCVITCLCTLPLCKLILWHSFSFSAIAWGKFTLILLLANIFYSTFTLWLTSRINSILMVDNAWMRFLYPLWSIGGFQFSWYALYNTFPLAAYANLCNPLVYITEGMRVALLGQHGFLPFYYCIAALSFFTIASGTYAFKTLKKRLDFV